MFLNLWYLILSSSVGSFLITHLPPIILWALIVFFTREWWDSLASVVGAVLFASVIIIPFCLAWQEFLKRKRKKVGESLIF